MKKIILLIILASPVLLHAQIGVKGGLNFAKVSNASDINSESKSGFHIGVFLAPPSKSLISSRTELLFSRQGYDYKSTNSGTVDLDYIQFVFAIFWHGSSTIYTHLNGFIYFEPCRQRFQ